MYILPWKSVKGVLHNQKNFYFPSDYPLADTMIKWWHIVMLIAAVLFAFGIAIGIVTAVVSYPSKWKSSV